MAQAWDETDLAAKANDPNWPDSGVDYTVTRSNSYDGDGSDSQPDWSQGGDGHRQRSAIDRWNRRHCVTVAEAYTYATMPVGLKASRRQ